MLRTLKRLAQEKARIQLRLFAFTAVDHWYSLDLLLLSSCYWWYIGYILFKTKILYMLPKHGRAKVPAEYRAIASIRLLYKTFAYMILGRVEPFLEAAQPEGQHGFRSGRRIEEHLVTANLVIDKSWSMNMPIWIISLDLSKAFERVHWPSLGRAQQGISDHMIWLLQNLYKDQTGQIAGTNESSRLFGF